MLSYPYLKRGLAAGLTLAVLGVALFVVTRNSAEPSLAQGGKQDWTMYGGNPSRNMVNTTAKGLPAEWDINPKKPVNIKWVANLGSKAYGGPIVAGGRVLIGTNNQKPREKKWDFIDKKTGKLVDLGVVMCFDEANGEFQWQAVHEKLPGGQVVDWPLEGICSSPYVEGDRIYYTSNRCEVICADIKTGKAQWTLDMIGKLGVFPHNITDNSPLLIGDDLFVITANGVNEDHLNVPAPKAPSFIRVDKKTGQVLWQDNSPSVALLNPPKGLGQKDVFKALVNSGRLIQHGQWSNVSYGVVNGQAQVIFPGGDGWIYAFDPKAKNRDEPIWKFDCNPKDAKYALRTGERSDFISTPVVYKDHVYIGTGQDPEHGTGIGHFWCIDMSKKGDVSEKLIVNDKKFPPETKDNPNSAKKWHYGGVITDKILQKKLGRNYYFGRTMSTAAIHDDLVYISDLSGTLHCLDAQTGVSYWEHETGKETWGSPYYADGKVYLGNDNGVVTVLPAAKKKPVPADVIENEMGAKVRATPVAANGVLYVMTENKLYAIAEKKK